MKSVDRGKDPSGRVRAVLLLGPVACWLVVVDYYRRDHHAVGFMGYSLVVALWVGAVVVTVACCYLVFRGWRRGGAPSDDAGH